MSAPGAAGRGLRVGVDIGGTFTDFVLLEEGEGAARVETLKLPSTPDDPSRAVLEGLERLLRAAGGAAAGEGEAVSLVHGSTVATNAVLEREGAETAFVATEGFGDLLAIGRQARPRLYDFSSAPAPPLVPGDRCLEVSERVGRDGEVVRPLDEADVASLRERLGEAGVESVAVCLLHSFLRPEHEERVAGALREAGFHVSPSHEVLPEFREYERASTTAVDAFVAPVIDRYLERLASGLPERGLGGAGLRIMQSDGGSVGVEAARRQAVRSVHSGPAAGVVGALEAGRSAGREKILSFDMGGTSTDVSLAEGEPRVTSEATVGGVPVAVPVVDLHTVGSGGGSIARVDEGGALRVGPASAGADPGPACYGLGGAEPTVTDAHLALGRLDPDRFLGGRLALEEGAARAAMEGLAERAGIRGGEGLSKGQAAALGVVRVADARMARALRVISVERGHDPADFALVAFGGAGGLHAASLARSVGVPTVVVPPEAATLSARGMLAADVLRHYAKTVMLPGEVEPGELGRRLEPLAERGRSELREEGFGEERIQVHRELDVRYRGQSYELTVPFGVDFADRFHEAHRRRYGHAAPDEGLEVVNVRVRAVGRVDAPLRPEEEPGGEDASEALYARRPVVVGTGSPGAGAAAVREVPFYRAEDLRPGHRLEGPGVVVRSDTTVYLGPPDRARVDGRRNLVLEAGDGAGDGP